MIVVTHKTLWEKIIIKLSIKSLIGSYQRIQVRLEYNCMLNYSICILQLHSNSDKGDGSVKYILTGEGAGTIFIIDDTTGDIHSTKSLDREQKTHYVLHAQAIDRRTNKPLEPESEFIIKVQDINDNAPKFTDGPYIVTVPEMSDMGKKIILYFDLIYFEDPKIYFEHLF